MNTCAELQGLCTSKTKGFGPGLVPRTTSKHFDHSAGNDNYEVFHCFEVVQWSLTEMIYRQLLQVILRTIQGLPACFCTHAADEWNMHERVYACIHVRGEKCILSICHILCNEFMRSISRGFSINKHFSSL